MSRLALVACLALGTSAAADTYVVPSAEAPTIGIALTIASDGDEILLNPGTHFETLDMGTANVSIRSVGGPDVTFIDAFGLGSCLRITGGQSGIEIEGITFRNGSAPRGGGIYLTGSDATVRNCRFEDNECLVAGGDGGAVFLENASMTFEDCAFVNNDSDNVGGAVYSRTNTTTSFTRCHFESNSSGEGGAVATLQANVTFEGCSFLMNEAIQPGGLLDGGALQAFDGTVHVERCTFEANYAADDGGAIMARDGAVVTVHNSIFESNECGSNSAVFYAWKTGSLISARHCTVMNSIAPGWTAFREFEGGNIEFRNGIVWGGVGGTPGHASVSIHYSVIEGGWDGPGNVDLDPMLDANYLPLAGSPAIDAANSVELSGPNPMDYAGNPRAVDDPDTADSGVSVYGLTADMGALEVQAEPAPPSTCDGDINLDGVVDTSDLLILLGSWGVCP